MKVEFGIRHIEGVFGFIQACFQTKKNVHQSEDGPVFIGRTQYLKAVSASQDPDEDLIEQQLSAAGLLDQKDDFDWPIGCLLGFCTVTDVLAQDDYREKYPDGPSQAPYVFICEDVHELDFKLQISGQHKLWKQPRDLHQSARLQLNL